MGTGLERSTPPTEVVHAEPKPAIHIDVDIPPRLLILPGVAIAAGLTIGFVRGSRAASLRFLAENAHRPPRTVQGWYFYQKTKNYRVILGGLKGGGIHAARLGTSALVWVGLEEGIQILGSPWNEGREIGAGVGSSLAFSTAYRLPVLRTTAIGLLVGATLRGLRWSKELLAQEAQSRVLTPQSDNDLSTDDP